MKLTNNDSEELIHKFAVLSDTPDLQDDYSLTQEQADEILESIPRNGGEWKPPTFATEAVIGELEDAAKILRDAIAEAAFSANERGQALAAHRQAKRFDGFVQELKGLQP